MIITTFGKRVKELRISKNLSQEKLGHRVELSFNQIGRIERGEINTSISTQYSISVALEISFAELMNFDIPGHLQELKSKA